MLMSCLEETEEELKNIKVKLEIKMEKANEEINHEISRINNLIIHINNVRNS